MGWFGPSPEKKLERALALLESGKHYEARKLFLEVLRKGGKLPGLAARAAEGERNARAGLIAARVAEASVHERAGDIGAARDDLETALDLAGADLERTKLEEALRRLASQPRAAAPSGVEELPQDLLAERPERDPAFRSVPEPTPEEVFGPDFEATFDLYMDTLPAETAALFRSQPEPFRRAYVAAQAGAARLALAYWDELGSAPRPAEIALEHARALLLDRRPAEALAVLDAIDARDVAVRWTRVEALRELGDREAAIDAAADLVNSQAAHDEATDALLAWTLLDAGRPDEAFRHLEGWLRRGTVSEEVLVPAAQAAAEIGRIAEARTLLEGLIQHRLHVSLQTGREPNFPIQAARRLLDFYLSDPGPDQERSRIRALVLHLLDFDPDQGERYRALLLRY